MKTYQETENYFSNYCKKNSISCLKLDFDLVSFDKSNYLKDINGKSPDFFCEKNGWGAFVEIKTFLKTQKFCDNIKSLKKFKNTVFMKNYLRSWDVIDNDALNDISLKFDNINNTFGYPSVAFFYMKFEEKDIFKRDLEILRKKHGYSYRVTKRDFDKNISALIYLNYDLGFFEIVRNSLSPIQLSNKTLEELFLQ